MTFIGGLVFFSITWWLVFFAVLPWGVRSHEEAGVKTEAGVPAGIPHNPPMLRKVLITTGITLLLLGAFYLVVEYDPFGYREFMNSY